MYYTDRIDAALQLIPLLEKYKGEDCVVLAVPRGGVPLADILAKKFGFPMELLMIKKIGHPANPEYAIGAVSMEDYIVSDQENVSSEYIAQQIKFIREKMTSRYKKFMGERKPVAFEKKTLIIVDDGVATGNTILAGIAMLRKRNPTKIVVAVPVSSTSAARKLREVVDDFICPYTPADFYGVGEHYRDFSEVTDDEVMRILNESS
jgi:predicted phosphoribosyltransferase